ncbi:hypothetical protein QQ008_04750 [Fulvivirgaceae bacterium BMA10]|uniref:Uncharacterized protein n=1 Tax=Splendidivirga corallicola TaxID=3051826 RepID=A0ABT8KJM9_9BACT|nr:hypothetical protein [Fulvivirgaceae bacterium BMA10]
MQEVFLKIYMIVNDALYAGILIYLFYYITKDQNNPKTKKPTKKNVQSIKKENEDLPVMRARSNRYIPGAKK